MRLRQPRSDRLAILAASAGVLLAPAAAAGAPPSITTDPSMFPGFSSTVTDYGVTCGGGTVRFTANASDSTRISLDGGPPSASIDSTLPLAVGQSFKWSLSRRVGSRTLTTTHYARCVPDDMNLPTVTRGGTPTGQLFLMSTGTAPRLDQELNPITTWYPTLFDANGVPVWWIKSPIIQLNPTVLDSTTFALFAPLGVRNPLGDFGFGRWQTYSFDQKLKTTLSTTFPGYDTHELQPGSKPGRYLTVTYRKEGPYDLNAVGGPTQAWGYRAVVQEVTAAGTVKWQWAASPHIATSELSQWWREIQARRNVTVEELPAYDLDHIASARLDGDGVILAFRHLDAVYRVSRATGNILWKLGGTTTGKSLAIIGDPYGPDAIGAPHDAFPLSGGRVGFIDVGLGKDHGPRFVIFRVDKANRTAEFVSQIASPIDSRPICCGSAQQLKSGNWAISWPGQPALGEYTPSGIPVLMFSLPPSKFSYRMQAFDKGVLSLPGLRSAMDRMYPRATVP